MHFSPGEFKLDTNKYVMRFFFCCCCECALSVLSDTLWERQRLRIESNSVADGKLRREIRCLCVVHVFFREWRANENRHIFKQLTLRGRNTHSMVWENHSKNHTIELTFILSPLFVVVAAGCCCCYALFWLWKRLTCCRISHRMQWIHSHDVRRCF